MKKEIASIHNSKPSLDELKNQIIQWALLFAIESHPWVKWVKERISNLDKIEYVDFKELWDFALKNYYEDFGTGDVGMDWDGFEENWETIKAKAA